jgi:hypothetical protein
MMMTFADGTRIAIESGASLSKVVHIAKNEAYAAWVCEKCTPDNVRHVTFSQPGPQGEDMPIGIYDNLSLNGDPVRDDNIVTISLKEEA